MSEGNNSSSGLDFWVGLACLAAGLYILGQRVIVHSGWYTWHFGGISLSSGLVTVPLIIGIIWEVYNPKSKLAKILCVIGAIFILATIIMSVRITFSPTSMFEYVLMFGLIAVGTGLLLRKMFKRG